MTLWLGSPYCDTRSQLQKSYELLDSSPVPAPVATGSRIHARRMQKVVRKVLLERPYSWLVPLLACAHGLLLLVFKIVPVINTHRRAETRPKCHRTQSRRRRACPDIASMPGCQ